MSEYITKILKTALCVTLCVILLASCGASGADVYLAEEITGKLSDDSEEWRELSDMLRMLTVDSTEIPEFDSTNDAIEYFRESLLNYMCCKNYRKYAGNSSLLDEINEENPGLDVTAAISEREFESEMYRAFGGSVKITHKSTPLFLYLENSSVYVPVTAPIEGGVELELTAVEESESAYRLHFDAKTLEHSSSYYALVVKRDDGSCYFSTLVRK